MKTYTSKSTEAATSTITRRDGACMVHLATPSLDFAKLTTAERDKVAAIVQSHFINHVAPQGTSEVTYGSSDAAYTVQDMLDYMLEDSTSSSKKPSASAAEKARLKAERDLKRMKEAAEVWSKGKTHADIAASIKANAERFTDWELEVSEVEGLSVVDARLAILKEASRCAALL